MNEYIYIMYVYLSGRTMSSEDASDAQLRPPGLEVRCNALGNDVIVALQQQQEPQQRESRVDVCGVCRRVQSQEEERFVSCMRVHMDGCTTRPQRSWNETHTHTHTQRERERDKEAGKGKRTS